MWISQPTLRLATTPLTNKEILWSLTTQPHLWREPILHILIYSALSARRYTNHERPVILHFQGYVHQGKIGGGNTGRRGRRLPSGRVPRLPVQDSARRGYPASAVSACFPPGLRRPMALVLQADLSALPSLCGRWEQAAGGGQAHQPWSTGTRRRPGDLVLHRARPRFLMPNPSFVRSTRSKAWCVFFYCIHVRTYVYLNLEQFLENVCM